MRRLRLWFVEQGIQVIEEGFERSRIYAFYLRLPSGAIQRMDLHLDVLELDPEAVIRNAFEPMLEYKRLA